MCRTVHHPWLESAAGFTTAIRLAGGEREHTLELVGEVVFELVALDVAEMRRADHVLEREQRVARVEYRLVLIDVDGSETRRACAQGRDQCAVFDQPGATGVDEDRRWLHPCKIRRLHQATRFGHEAHVHRQHVGLLEHRFSVRGDVVAVVTRCLTRFFARPDHYAHAERLPVARDLLADPAVAVYAEGSAAQSRSDARLPLPAFQTRHLGGNGAHGADDETPRELRRGEGRARVFGAEKDAAFGARIDVDVRKRTFNVIIFNRGRRSMSGLRIGLRSRRRTSASVSRRRSASLSASRTQSCQTLTL